MNQTIGTIEVVTFNVKEGISEIDAQQSLETLNDCIKEFPGFLGRKLSKNEDGQWMDLVFWANQKSAEEAAEKVMQNPDALKAFGIINESTLQMRHYDIKNDFKTEMSF